MSNGSKKRTRLDRVAALDLPPGKFRSMLEQLQRRDVALRLSLAVLAAVAMWALNGGWLPPFRHHLGDVPNRDILASVMFTEPNPAATEDARQKAREEARYVYAQNAEPLVQLRAALRNSVVAVISAPTYEALDKNVWQQFQPPLADVSTPPSRGDEEAEFETFRKALAGDRELVKFQQSLATAMAGIERRGLLEKLPPEHELKGNHQEIVVYPVKDPKDQEIFRIEDVLIGAISVEDGALQQRLAQHFDNKELSSRVYNWLRPRLVPTLKLDPVASERAREKAAAEVPDEKTIYQVGHLLAKAEQPLTAAELHLLQLEYDQRVEQFPLTRILYRSVGMVGLVLLMFVPCGVFMYRCVPRLLSSFRRYAMLLLMMVVTAGVARWWSEDTWRAEIIPLLLFGMTIAIAYSRALAVILSSLLAVLLVLSLGQGVGHLLILVGVVESAVLLLSNIRSRSKLIKIGFFAALVALAVTVLAGLIDGRPLTLATWMDLLTHAGKNALWTLLVGFLITGLLPFIERIFGVLTDISLLELGDAAHPLLQELVRRAPGTYNHSINVASLAEPAAESIGARGLLVRVGAYFHDIGKMLKPGYFVENQGTQASRHETLVPAMSTLIIIAHIKDGADLARQHHLPQPIIDFIEQHHGTTLVEYFFRRASEQSEASGGEVEESAFRYPGPKPQTREAAVLMLADAVESASRVLVEPTPSRIKDLVDDIAMKRLLDGQFDECEMTLQDIRTVQDSLIKSLIAVYHGRIKYPDQKTA